MPFDKMDNAITSFRGEFAFLSNMFTSPIVVDGIEYRSVENFFHAQKCTDPVERKRIASLSPREAKGAGRHVRLRKDWNSIRMQVMETGLEAKFADSFLRKSLLDTGHRPITEENTWGDRFWGTVNGCGQNHLGKMLMLIREKIRDDP
jgi:ribA/ribD-fused uncharacterized protein